MENKRKKRTRYKLKKVSERKRLTVFKSNNYLYAQIINDQKGVTLASVSSLEKEFKKTSGMKNLELAGFLLVLFFFQDGRDSYQSC